MRRFLTKLLSMLTTIIVVLAMVAVAALAASARLRSGKWAMPNREDVQTLVKEIVKYEQPEPSRTIYLHRGALELSSGADNARTNTSSLVDGPGPFVVPRYKASNATWRRLVACVESKFAGYDVRITDERPTSGDYILVKVGGSPADIGLDGQRLGGIAPFNGYAVPNSVVFAFDQRGRSRTQNNCQTVAHEVGHVYGLDHSLDCKDIMSYQQCGPKTFVNKPAPCGEYESRACEGDATYQNSVARLTEMLGTKADDHARN